MTRRGQVHRNRCRMGGRDPDFARCAEESAGDRARPGGAAYYGRRSRCRPRRDRPVWQMSTIQYDLTGRRFELEYTAADGSLQCPVMIHSAKFGSIERLIGVLVEHYAGAFPVWLAPVQVVAIPVAGEFNDYLEGIAARMREAGMRVEVDDSDDRFPKKIRTAQKQKVPYMLIAGGEDRAADECRSVIATGPEEWVRSTLRSPRSPAPSAAKDQV